MKNKYMLGFTREDYFLMISALEEKQHKYIVGDRMYEEYGSLIKELYRRKESAIPWRC